MFLSFQNVHWAPLLFVFSPLHPPIPHPPPFSLTPLSHCVVLYHRAGLGPCSLDPFCLHGQLAHPPHHYQYPPHPPTPTQRSHTASGGTRSSQSFMASGAGLMIPQFGIWESPTWSIFLLSIFFLVCVRVCVWRCVCGSVCVRVCVWGGGMYPHPVLRVNVGVF